MKVMLLGGPPPFLAALAKRPDIDASIAVVTSAERAQYEGDAETFSLPLHKVRPSVWPRLRREIQSRRPEVLHAFFKQNLTNALAATLGMAQPPLIVSFRGVTAPLTWKDPGNALIYGSRRVTIHGCESRAVLESMLASGVPRERCRVIYNCMNEPPRRAATRKALEHEFGIPQSVTVVGSVANIRRVKGTDLLLQAALRLSEDRDLHWLLIGRPDEPEMLRAAKEPALAGRIHLAGYRADAAEWIGACDLFAAPSRAEALCRALLEAMYQGVCPVVSDAGGMKELVRHGVEGLVTPSEDVEKLAESIALLKQDAALRSQMAASARRRVNEEFNGARMAERAADIYNAALANSPQLDSPRKTFWCSTFRRPVA